MRYFIISLIYSNRAKNVFICWILVYFFFIEAQLEQKNLK